MKPNYSIPSQWLFTALLAIGIVRSIDAQCPANTMTSFERIGGYTVKDSLLTPLYEATNISIPIGSTHVQLSELTRQLQAHVSSSAHTLNIPITAECNNRCRRSAKCRAFLVDYANHVCYSIEQPSSVTRVTGALTRQPPPIRLLPAGPDARTAYFEKVCIPAPTIDCERAWVYERVPAHILQGYDDKIIEEVPSRARCQEFCLQERQFRCRSGEYDYLTMQCRLSMADRHLSPSSFKQASQDVDYFENQCVPIGYQCESFERFEDFDLGRAEIMRTANTSEQCQQFCTQIIKAFICRSYTWNPLTGKCYLNSVNANMIGGVDRLIPAPGLIYYQRNDCIDLRLECDTTAMTLNLRTKEPFRGRIYVRDEPHACETVGRSALTSVLSIPFQSSARCVQRELPNRYSSVIVVQQHPTIQRKSDRYVKVVCDFQTANRTVTSTYNVVANPWTSAALINSTSFAPKIRLRITDKFGLDITGAKLGDELYLRIEAETDSVYDMVARSVLAKSGTTDESIALIDKDGCPTDFRIFPPLKKLNRRTIIGKFDAFKFSSDVVVRFQVDVQFCLNQCPESTCDQPLLNLPNGFELASTPGGLENYAAGLSTVPPALTSHSEQPTQDSHPMLNSIGEPITTTHQRPTTTPSLPQSTAQHTGTSSNAPTTTSGGHYFEPMHGAHRHPSIPANQPIVHAISGSRPQQAAQTTSGGGDTVLSTTSDPQMFDGQSAPRSLGGASNQQASLVNKARSAPKTGNDPSDITNATNGAVNAAAAANGNRRRRAIEPPAETRHVPLQREIIVEPASANPSSTGNPKNSPRSNQKLSQGMSGGGGGDARRSGSQTGASGSGQRAQPNTRYKLDQPANAKELRSSSGLDDSNGDNDDSYGDGSGISLGSGGGLGNGNLAAAAAAAAAADNRYNGEGGYGDLGKEPTPCAMRQSLVLALLAFCLIQFLTIIFCLIIWLHRRDSAAKFKVKLHPVGRLY